MDEQNIHKEHRLRMKKRFRENGLEGFSDHEVLELLLFFGIPFKNTNDIAHHLINRFGSLSGVLETEYTDLLEIDGIGENTGTLLKFIPELFRRYSVDKRVNGSRFLDLHDIGEYLVNSYIGTVRERVDILLFDSGMRLIAHLELSEGSFEGSLLDSGRLAEIVFSHHAISFALAHNHPSGTVDPSDADLMITREIYKAFIPFKKYMISHFIVANGEYADILPKAISFFADEMKLQKADFH